MKKLITILLFIVVIPSSIMAEKDKPQVFADSWGMVPKADSVNKFQEALKTHLAYRKENGDSRQWNTYTAVTGSKLNMYYVRFCCTTWADHDKYVEVANNLSKHFNDNVHPHVKKYTHNFHIIDQQNNHWPEGTDASYVGVTTYTPVKGMWTARKEAITEMSKLAMENKWPRHWGWSYAVGGDGSWVLATPFKNYADMAPMEESFYEFSKKHLKSAEKADKMFEKFRSAYSEANYTIYRHRKDLSTQ